MAATDQEEQLCICPVIEIRAHTDHVTPSMMRQIATDLRASVTLVTPRSITTVFGKHWMTCPCWTQKAEERK